MHYEKVLADLRDGSIDTSLYSLPQSDGTDIDYQRKGFLKWFQGALERNRMAWCASIDLAEQDWVDEKRKSDDLRYIWSPFQYRDPSSYSIHGSEVWWIAFVLKQVPPRFLQQLDLDTGRPFSQGKKGHRIIPNHCLHITPVSDVEYGGTSTEEPAVVIEQEMMRLPENVNVKKPSAAFKEWLLQASRRLRVNDINLPSPPSSELSAWTADVACRAPLPSNLPPQKPTFNIFGSSLGILCRKKRSFTASKRKWNQNSSCKTWIKTVKQIKKLKLTKWRFSRPSWNQEMGMCTVNCFFLGWCFFCADS